MSTQVVGQTTQRGAKVGTAQYSQAPEHLIEPGPGRKQLPPGHALFGMHAGGNGGMKHPIYVFLGHPYNMAGEKLPADSRWLKDNGFFYDENVAKVMHAQQRSVINQSPDKLCTQCSSPNLASAKFCQECGTRLGTLWTPNSGDDEGDRIAKLLDPSDPFASIKRLADTTPAPQVESPGEIFERLKAGLENEAAADLRNHSGYGQAVSADATVSMTTRLAPTTIPLDHPSLMRHSANAKRAG